jgi:hypothetical protein
MNRAYSLSGWLKIEAVGSSETLVSTYNFVKIVISDKDSECDLSQYRKPQKVVDRTSERNGKYIYHLFLNNVLRSFNTFRVYVLSGSQNSALNFTNRLKRFFFIKDMQCVLRDVEIKNLSVI